MITLSYTCRLHAFKRPTTYTLDDDTLHWLDDKGEGGTLPLRETSALHLKYEPTRFAEDRYLARIESPNQSITLSNLSYVSIADFHPVDQAYREFVTTLTRRIVDQSPTAEIYGGDKAFTYRVYQLISVAVLLLILGGVWFLYAIDLPEIIGLKVLLLIYYLPKLKAYMDANKPKQLDPLELPEAFLPQAR